MPGPDPTQEPPDTPTGWLSEGEFIRQWGLGGINAQHRLADRGPNGRGLGAGTLGAIMDSGAEVTNPEFAGRIDLVNSYSYDTRSNNVTDLHRHGTDVLGISGAAFNGAGIMGIAPEARFVIYQLNEFETSLSGLLMSFADVQRRAIELDVDAINHSWALVAGESDNAPEITISGITSREDYIRRIGGNGIADWMVRAAEADVVNIFAAGNGGGNGNIGYDQVGILAGAPVFMPELAGAWVAVAAHDEIGDITNFSNRCGRAMNHCLTAPGINIFSVTGRPRKGTSFAAPHVHGSILLLRSLWPEMTNRDTLNLLFETAEDAGASGTDPIYGRGRLDLENAVRPQGALMFQMSGVVGERAQDARETFIAPSPVFGSALARALSGQEAVATDAFDRGFDVPLSQFAMTTENAGAASRLANAAGGAETASGRLNIRLGTGSGALPAFGLSPFHDPDSAVAAGVDLGDGLSMRATASDGAVSSRIAMAGGGVSVGLELGQKTEAGTALGAAFGGAFGAGLTSNTAFARLEAEMDLSGALALTAAFDTGRTALSGGGLIEGGDIATAGFGLGAKAADVFGPGDALTVAVARPLGVAHGSLRVNRVTGLTPAAGGARTNGVERATDDVALGGADRPMELQMGYSAALGIGRADFRAIYAPDAQRDGLAVRLGYAIRF